MLTKSEDQNKPIFRKPWRPNKWHPVYERVVALAAAGLKNTEIAEAMGYTPQHVSNILRTPEANRISNNMRERSQKTMADDLQLITEAAIKNVKHVIVDNAETYQLEAPFKLLDRSITFLKGIGKLQNDGGNTNIQNNLILPESYRKQLTEGIDKLKEVWTINGGPDPKVAQALTDAEVID
jgi:hypothetical protein